MCHFTDIFHEHRKICIRILHMTTGVNFPKELIISSVMEKGEQMLNVKIVSE